MNVVCPNCGAQNIDAGAALCPDCGQRLKTFDGATGRWWPLVAVAGCLLRVASGGSCAAILYVVAPFRHNIYLQIFLALLVMPAIISAIVETIREVIRRRK